MAAVLMTSGPPSAMSGRDSARHWAASLGDVELGNDVAGGGAVVPGTPGGGAAALNQLITGQTVGIRLGPLVIACRVG